MEYILNKINIAIDGPASAGKSTIARILAQRLNYIYIDTGAMYRALTYLALKQKIDLSSSVDLVTVISQMDFKFQRDPIKNRQLVFLGEQEVTDLIRSNEVTSNVSEVSAHLLVREKMVEAQRLYAKNKGVVMDGRDIGTVVLKDAEVKIFLVASVEERAKRRLLENQEKGISTDFEILKKEIIKRDTLDSKRSASPLRPAEDSILVDTTQLTINQVLEEIELLIKRKVISEEN
jgi:cytidylate kinase